MTNLRQINPFMARFQNQPALLEEGRAEWLQSCMSQVAEKAEQFDEAMASDDFWGEDDDSWLAYVRPYKVKDGILHIPVRGVLLNNFPFAFGQWATGYEYIWEAAKRGVSDPNVRGIALVIDSGGGMVAGNFDLNDRLFSLRGAKPIRAYANEHAYSAAYSIASCADDITVARTGGVGSIGVVVVHMEMSKMLEQWGITTTIIRSKPGKMEGNGYESLSEDARGRIQERVDEFHNQFVALVARNRAMTAEAVDETGALTFMANQAIDNGLADEVGNFDDAITAFAASFHPKEDSPMANENQATVTQEQLEKAVATATEAAKAEGVKEGASAERERIGTILNSDAGQKRPKAALRMATNEKFAAVDADAIVEALGDLPEEKAAAPEGGAGAPKGMLKAAMRGTDQPNITAPVEDEGEQGAPVSRAQRASAMVRSN